MYFFIHKITIISLQGTQVPCFLVFRHTSTILKHTISIIMRPSVWVLFFLHPGIRVLFSSDHTCIRVLLSYTHKTSVLFSRTQTYEYYCLTPIKPQYFSHAPTHTSTVLTSPSIRVQFSNTQAFEYGLHAIRYTRTIFTHQGIKMRFRHIQVHVWEYCSVPALRCLYNFTVFNHYNKKTVTIELYAPVFDGTYCGMASSVRPSVNFCPTCNF